MEGLSAWVPLFQTMAWIVFGGIVLFALRRPVASFADAIASRARAGDAVELGFAGFSTKLGELTRVPAQLDSGADSVPDVDDWTVARKQLRDQSRSVYLAHVLKPTTIPGQKYEVFIFLVGHRRSHWNWPDDLSDIDSADFFLGGAWNNKVFSVAGSARQELGIRTAAYGPTPVVCRIRFTDGHTAIVNRYVDFEMAPSPDGRP